MKYLESVVTKNETLIVLVETGLFDFENKAAISYFINGVEVTVWSSLTTYQSEMLTAIADIICREHKLIKWSY